MNYEHSDHDVHRGKTVDGIGFTSISAISIPECIPKDNKPGQIVT